MDHRTNTLASPINGNSDRIRSTSHWKALLLFALGAGECCHRGRNFIRVLKPGTSDCHEAARRRLRPLITMIITVMIFCTVVTGMALILEIDRFMSMCRAMVNMIGNGVATLVVTRWENERDRTALQRNLSTPAIPSPTL